MTSSTSSGSISTELKSVRKLAAKPIATRMRGDATPTPGPKIFAAATIKKLMMITISSSATSEIPVSRP